MIARITNFNKEFDDSSNLQRFINVFRKFNSGIRIKPKIEAEIQQFFEFKWANDRN